MGEVPDARLSERDEGDARFTWEREAAACTPFKLLEERDRVRDIVRNGSARFRVELDPPECE